MRQKITRNQSYMIQGIAILFMVFHHMFSDLSIYLGFLDTPYPQTLLKAGWFCKMCVALFAFISGYGIHYVLKKNTETKVFSHLQKSYQLVCKQLFSVYCKYWLIVCLFCIYGLFTNRLTITPHSLLGNLSGLETSYQSTWWYMGQYAVMLLMAPFMELFFLSHYFEKTERHKKYILLGGIALLFFLFILLGLTIAPVLIPFLRLCIENLRISFLLAFIMGYMMSRFQIYEKIGTHLSTHKWIPILLSVISLLLIVGIRVKLATFPAYAKVDFLLVPLFVYSCITLITPLKGLSNVLQWFGKHATFLWLTHGFILASILPQLLHLTVNPAILYLAVVLSSALFSSLLALFYRKLSTKKAPQ